MDDYFLVDAKQEYTTYLISILTPSIYNGFKDIYEQSKKIQNANSVFKNFQILLSNVPQWNNYLLEKEVNHIIKETSCDWLDNLITAVFVSHSKILTSVKVGNYKPKSKKIDLKIPDTINFIHQCYLESARVFYKNPLLFLDDPKKITTEEYLKNYQIIKNTIKESVLMTIRKMLPFKNILNEYLSLENNTLAIGAASSVHGLLPPPQTIELPKTIENPPKITNKLIENVPLETNPSLIETLPINKNKEHSESEKEIVVKGKELVLDEEDFNETVISKQKEPVAPKKKRTRTPSKPKRFSKSLSPKRNHVVNNKTESDSINSKTIGDIVSQIRNEIDASKVEQFKKSTKPNGNIQALMMSAKDIQANTIPATNIQGDTMLAKDIQGDMISERDFQGDTMLAKDTQVDTMLAKDIQGDIISERDFQADIMSARDIQSEISFDLNKLNEFKLDNESENLNNALDVRTDNLNNIFGALDARTENLNNALDARTDNLNNIFGALDARTDNQAEPTIVSKNEVNFQNKLVQNFKKREEKNGDLKSNPSESNVKKISIKYSVGGNLNNKGKNKKSASSKQKTVLIDSADDTDSSEMPF
jgi:hypothetical protein